MTDAIVCGDCGQEIIVQRVRRWRNPAIGETEYIETFTVCGCGPENVDYDDTARDDYEQHRQTLADWEENRRWREETERE